MTIAQIEAEIARFSVDPTNAEAIAHAAFYVRLKATMTTTDDAAPAGPQGRGEQS